jgi:hypothetical protein
MSATPVATRSGRPNTCHWLTTNSAPTTAAMAPTTSTIAAIGIPCRRPTTTSSTATDHTANPTPPFAAHMPASAPLATIASARVVSCWIGRSRHCHSATLCAPAAVAHHRVMVGGDSVP